MGLLPLVMIFTLAQEPQKGTIEVTVRDSVSSQPIPGAEITFIFFQTPPPNVVTRTTVDDNGRAVFSELTLGRYSIQAQRDGFINAQNVLSNPPTILDAQNPKRSVDLTLTRGAALNGRIRDSRGLSVAQAQVQVLRKGYRDGRAMLMRQLNSRTETDDRGEYRIIGLAPGDYFLQAELRPTLTAAQDKYSRISYYPGTTDVLRAAPIKISGPADLAGMDITIPDTAAYTISGIAINAVPGGRLLPNGQRQRTIASFFIGPRDTTSIEEPVLVTNRLYVSGANDLDESPFEFAGFTPGSYYMYPIVDGDAPVSFFTKRTAVEVNDKNIEGLTITITPAPDVKGKVIIEGDASAIRMEQLRLVLRWKENMPGLISIRTSDQNVDPKTGEFTLKTVPESRFTPVINGLPPDAYISDLRQGARSLNIDSVVTVGTEAPDPIQITINTRGGAVQGIAQNPSQQPVPNAGVVLVPTAPRRGNSLLYKRVTADASGRFTMRGIAPGSYKVFAWPALPEGSAEENAEFLAPFEGRGSTVNVDATGTANVEARVIQ